MANINALRVVVRTGNVGKGGTDDKVWFDVGKFRWLLDNPGRDDFERGSDDTFDLPVPQAMTEDDIWRILVCKAPDGDNGGWKLEGLRVEVNGTNRYGAAINQWLEDETAREWTPGDFRPTAAVPANMVVPQAAVATAVNQAVAAFVNSEKKFKLLSGPRVDVECPGITFNFKLEYEVAGPNPKVKVGGRFVPAISNGAVEVSMPTFDIDIDLPTAWYLAAAAYPSLGALLLLVEPILEKALKPEIRKKVKEVLTNNVAQQLKGVPLQHVSTRPSGVELFVK